MHLKQLYNNFFRSSKAPTCPASMRHFLQGGTHFELSLLEIDQIVLYFRLSYIKTLSGSLPKSGPFIFASENQFL